MEAKNEKKTAEISPPSIKQGDILQCEVIGFRPLALTCQCAEKSEESIDSSAKPMEDKKSDTETKKD